MIALMGVLLLSANGVWAFEEAGGTGRPVRGAVPANRAQARRTALDKAGSQVYACVGIEALNYTELLPNGLSTFPP